jgi:hypothetical protein
MLAVSLLTILASLFIPPATLEGGVGEAKAPGALTGNVESAN